MKGKGLRPVDRNGEMWTKPKPYKPDGSLNHDYRPPDVLAEVWWNLYSTKSRKEFWEKRWGEHMSTKPPFPGHPTLLLRRLLA